MLQGAGYFHAFAMDMLWGKCELFFHELQQILIMKHYPIPSRHLPAQS